MKHQDLWQEILSDVRSILTDLAKSNAKTVSLSPETVALLSHTTDPTVNALKELEQVVSGCTKCPLYATRTQTVFGTGNPHARLMFVGEAPGADEDRQGEPFVGAAGQLLTQIIQKGMKLKRSDVYICNVLKCRPPNNRDPRTDEIEQCRDYLFQQIEWIRPEVICALGAHAARTLLRVQDSTSRLRGKWHFYGTIPVRVTYHPSYLLRCKDDKVKEREEKRKVWEDIQAIMRFLNGEEIPSRDPINDGTYLWQ
ncbi:MAG TPA: uracil-DNA glycosylase [Candidatus Hydrogenedentes bacterium]|nr:uracil-DNA glycosylase [Candidatus Hydrogenedentota bacterium]HOL77999.1 uracil-DNA glycosylase [Candidatus Hydrogenedentota bacterium]HPO87081.1 uracil-DNA glycosylase [Candidatus Hydrogenedentota bacterium]